MRVAILSAGPCLLETYDPDAGHDLRIGVNRAAGSFACDWWSCGDAQTFAEHVPIGSPVLFTMTDNDGQFRRFPETAERLTGHRMVLWSECSKGMAGKGVPSCWTNWSITAALVLAAWLGATSVDVHGHYYEGEDASNCTDVSGRKITKRVDNRPRVIADWQTVKGWALERGMGITEHRS